MEEDETVDPTFSTYMTYLLHARLRFSAPTHLTFPGLGKISTEANLSRRLWAERNN